MRGQCWLLLAFLLPLCTPSIKTLSTSCFCDVSTDCDVYCCCDQDCSAAVLYNWNNYTQCASDGYPIPLCSSYYNEPMHKHDLYQGLRMIYTIIKRIFCISKVNFVDPAKGFSSSTTDSQISLSSNTVAATAFSGLTPITTYSNLPLRNSMGICGQYVLRDMNSIAEGECRTLLSSTSSLSSHSFLLLSQLTGNNNITASSLTAYLMTSPSAPAQLSTANSTTCTLTTCLVVKQIRLFFIKSSSGVTIDYSSSYVVLGNTVITAPTYVYIKYSYQFVSQSGNFPYSSSVGYAINSPLSFLKSVTNTSNYYKIFNPVNLAFINIDGTCRTNSNTSDADHSNLISFKFGVNSVYSCQGTTNLTITNLRGAIDYVASIGSASTSLSDYVAIDYSGAGSATNQNLQVIFYYATIGTQANPQYQIIKAAVNALGSSTGQFTLFVEYMPVSNSVVLNLPSPPVIDAYLPDDFLYPFYVA